MNAKYLPRSAEFKKMLDNTHKIQEKINNKEINSPEQVSDFRKLRENAKEDLTKENLKTGFLSKAFKRHASDWAVIIIAGTSFLSAGYKYVTHYMDTNEEKIDSTVVSKNSKEPKVPKP